MNESILAILLVVIICALIASIVTTMIILSKLIKHFNDMDHQYISIRTSLDRLVGFKDDERWKQVDRYVSTRNRLDAIIGSLDDLCNVCENISEDTHSIKAEEVEEVAKQKDLKETKLDNQEKIYEQVRTMKDHADHLIAEVDDIHAVQRDTHKAVVEFKDRTANDIVKMRGELDSILECLDRNHRELNLIFNDMHTMCKMQTQEFKLKQKKRFEEEGYAIPPKNDAEVYDIKGRIDDGECADCMFRFKNEHEEPCNKCCNAYISQFSSRKNKE